MDGGCFATLTHLARLCSVPVIHHQTLTVMELMTLTLAAERPSTLSCRNCRADQRLGSHGHGRLQHQFSR